MDTSYEDIKCIKCQNNNKSLYNFYTIATTMAITVILYSLVNLFEK